MGLTGTAVSAGTAHRVLADAVATAKAGDPLRPVTVIVPTNAAGVIARRQLGSLGGVAAVDFVTLYRLAERLAGPVLRSQSRLPVSTAVVDVAVRNVLDSTSTAFDAVSQHPSTVVALRDLHRQLRIAGPDAAHRLANASRRGGDVARVSVRVAERLAADWYDEGDLLVHATERVASGAAPLSPVVMFLPQPLGPLEVALVTNLGARTDLSVLVALSGDSAADQDLHALTAQFGVALPDASPVTLRPIDRVSVTDADEEARYAVRCVVDAARTGTPLASMAILWPVDRPYARLVEHHLDAAGIAWNGRPGTLVSERLVPRFLLDLLDVDRRRLRRRDLFDLLADVPVRLDDGERAPLVAWERASREAGVVRDEHWTPRLRAHAAWQRRRAQAHTDDPNAVSVPSADKAEALADFVAELRRQLGHPSSTRAWSDWADWSVTQIEQRIGTSVLQRLDEAEFQAWEHTIRVLDRLRHLDRVGGPATRSQFRAVFASEFDVAPGRLGRIGSGVTIGSLAGAVGLVSDLTVVLGAAEGLMPSPPRIDPLVSDSDRVAAGLPTSASVADRAHRQLLGVIESSTRVVVLSPRGDLRSTTARHPSRWLLGLAIASEVDVASHASALLTTPFPATDTAHRLRRRTAQALLGGAATVQRSAVAEGDSVLARALALRSARRLDTLTVYDGDLSTAGVPALDRRVSPTQLQSWGACPHAYFVQYLLGVRAIEEPGDELAITAIDRGNVLHDVLDSFHREVIGGQLPQPSGKGWTEVHYRRLIELLVLTTDRFEKSGRTGRAAYWAVDQQRIAADLLHWAERDGLHAIERNAEVVASEHRFGYDGDVALTLPDGRRLAVYGSVDRIDRTTTGLVVTDHKTGSTKRYTGIGHDDPTAACTHFQLPAYAAAAAAGHAFEGTVRAEYSFFQGGKYDRIGYEFDAGVWERVSADLAHVVSGIEGGWFPAAAEQPKFQFYTPCIYCDPDELGTAERFAEWDRKRHDPRLATWFAPDDQPQADES